MPHISGVMLELSPSLSLLLSTFRLQREVSLVCSDVVLLLWIHAC